MPEPEHVVEVARIDGKARVTRVEDDALDIDRGRVRRNRDHLGARHHYVGGVFVSEDDGAREELVPDLTQDTLASGFGDEGGYVLCRVPLFELVDWLHADEPKQAVGDRVEQTDEGAEEVDEQAEGRSE